VLEAVRECLQDVYDLPALTAIAERIRARRIRFVDVATDTASPFAASLLFDYVGAFMYEGDAPLAERRAAALSLDPGLLAELLGTVELRELLDPIVVEETERMLQRRHPDRLAKGEEGVADLLRDERRGGKSGAVGERMPSRSQWARDNEVARHFRGEAELECAVPSPDTNEPAARPSFALDPQELGSVVAFLAGLPESLAVDEASGSGPPRGVASAGGVPTGVGLAVGSGPASTGGVATGVAGGVGTAVGDGVAVTSGVGVAAGVAVGVGSGPARGVAVGTGVGVGVGAGVVAGGGVAVTDGVAVGVGLGVEVGSGPAQAGLRLPVRRHSPPPRPFPQDETARMATT